MKPQHPQATDGRCEDCDRPGSEREAQWAVSVMTGGPKGTAPGILWLCAACVAKREARRIPVPADDVEDWL